MKNTIAETSIAIFIYSRGDNQHSSVPGHFEVFDKIREETYWEMDCYDGGQGLSNKTENSVKRIGIEKFLLLNDKCKKIQTEADVLIIQEITTLVSVQINNPKYYGFTPQAQYHLVD